MSGSFKDKKRKARQKKRLKEDLDILANRGQPEQKEDRDFLNYRIAWKKHLIHKYEAPLIYDKWLADERFYPNTIPGHPYEIPGMPYESRDVGAVSAMRRDANRQHTLMLAGKRAREIKLMKSVLDELPGFSKKQKRQFIEDAANSTTEDLGVRYAILVPSKKANDINFEEKTQRALDRGMRAAELKEYDKQHEAEKTARAAKLQSDEYANFINAQRPIPDPSILSARAVAAAQATAGGVANIREWRPHTEQELVDAGYAMSRNQVRNILQDNPSAIFDFLAPPDEPDEL
jgi:hypothetical protein